MFNEDNTTEQMIIKALENVGWTYIAPDNLEREHSDVMVEPMVKNALIRLNPEIAEEPDRADEVIYRLRALIQSCSAQNLVTTNERFKKLVFEENSFPFGKDGRMVPIRFFGTEQDGDLDQNEYVVTNQWVYPYEYGGKRLDIVLLINGFPVVNGEVKTPVRDSITWIDGAGDVANYEKSIPQMYATNVLNFASEGKAFRFGSVNMPVDMWGPWHAGGDRAEGTLSDVRKSVMSMLTPANLMDIFRFFTVFSTDKKHRRIKLICRYQQFEGANLIVERVKAGYPKKGLIWHFQGSGKSLLMVFAAQKLRMVPELKNPTVVIVDDRIDLETQITATFNAADIPNMASAGTKEELVSFFRNDTRKILITTIFKFGEVDGILNERSNIILMVDEAHRTQEGDLGEKMRMALPNAFFFGLTGTPINRIDKNTFRAFGAEEDKTGYMSRYSFSDSIRDNATLPLHFETVPVELHVDQAAMDEAFAAMTEGLTDEERNELTRRVRIEAVMKAPDRIRKVCEHIAQHFREKVEPDGLKGMVVCYDRECCLLYKEQLDKLLGADACTIVMHTNNDKAGRYVAYRRDRDAEEKLLDRYRDPDDPLKILIVTAKLLTGFDAPILQAMYLDKPLKDHTLLQAICRTNRVYNDHKAYGLIVDYIGLFDDVAPLAGLRREGGPARHHQHRRGARAAAEARGQMPLLLRKPQRPLQHRLGGAARRAGVPANREGEGRFRSGLPRAQPRVGGAVARRVPQRIPIRLHLAKPGLRVGEARRQQGQAHLGGSRAEDDRAGPPEHHRRGGGRRPRGSGARRGPDRAVHREQREEPREGREEDRDRPCCADSEARQEQEVHKAGRAPRRPARAP